MGGVWERSCFGVLGWAHKNGNGGAFAMTMSREPGKAT
jgi:hypothetical protein